MSTEFRWSLELSFKASSLDSFPSVVLATTVSRSDCSEASDLISAPGRHSTMSDTLCIRLQSNGNDYEKIVLQRNGEPDRGDVHATLK